VPSETTRCSTETFDRNPGNEADDALQISLFVKNSGA
jgi:hypothetical protein